MKGTCAGFAQGARRQVQPARDPVGEGGARINDRVAARGDMETLFGRVYLDVWVRVKSGWSDSDAMLARLGY